MVSSDGESGGVTPPNDMDDQAAANHPTITLAPIRRSGPSVGSAMSL